MKRTDVLSKRQVLAIPSLVKRLKTIERVAAHYEVSWQAIWYWIKQLRERGFDVQTLPRGKKSLLGKNEVE